MERTRLGGGDGDLLPGPSRGGGVEDVNVVEGCHVDRGLATIDVNVSIIVLNSCMSESCRDGISCNGSVVIGTTKCGRYCTFVLFVCCCGCLC